MKNEDPLVLDFLAAKTVESAGIFGVDLILQSDIEEGARAKRESFNIARLLRIEERQLADTWGTKFHSRFLDALCKLDRLYGGS